MGLTGEVANLIVALKLDDRGFSGKMNGISRSLKGLDGGLSQMGRGVGQVGTGLARLGTVAAAAAAGGLAAVVTTAASMEEAFIGIQKTVDETASTSFEDLRKTLRQMSSDTGTAFEDLSRIGEIGGALGVGIADLDAFIDIVNRLSVSTDLTVETASTALGQLGVILDLKGEDLRGFADDLVALGNAGASTEPQIVDLAARFAAAGNRAGLTSGEILALSSAVASMGVEVEAGGTALSMTFNNIATAIGTGSKEVKGFTDVLGISAKEFRRRWETDALGVFQEFLREIDKLPPIEQAVAFEMAGITGSRQLSAIGLMADKWGYVGAQLEIVRDNQNDLGIESDKFFGASANQFRRLRENLRLTADTIGVELLPITNELISDFVKFAQLDTTQAGLKSFAKDLAGGVRGLVKELKGTDFSGIIGGMKIAAEVAKGAFDAFRALPAPVQQLAIAALVANKVSGGAVGQIAKGLGNILMGGAKVGGGVAGLFGGRGGSPVNPMYVAVTNQLPGGGGAGGVAGGLAGAKSFLPKGLGGWLGFLGIAAVDFVLISEAVSQFEKQKGNVEVAATFEREVVASRSEDATVTELQGLRSDLERNRRGSAGGIPIVADLLKGVFVNPELSKQIQKVDQSILAQSISIQRGDDIVRNELRAIGAEDAMTNRLIREANLRRLGQAADAAASNDRAMLITTQQYASEQRQATSVARAIAYATQDTSARSRESGGYLSRIAAKNFSPTINLTNVTTVAISTTALQTQVNRVRIAVNDPFRGSL